MQHGKWLRNLKINILHKYPCITIQHGKQAITAVPKTALNRVQLEAILVTGNFDDACGISELVDMSKASGYIDDYAKKRENNGGGMH